MSYLCAIDQGTSSTRAIVFSKDGKVLSAHQMEHNQIFPNPGYVEHDAEEIWSNCVTCVQTALSKNGYTNTDICAIGITNQRETTVVWNRLTGKPYHNAIVWNDIRTTEICKRLSSAPHDYELNNKDKYRSKTGLPIASYFSLAKLIYLLENVPGLREASESGDAIFGTIDCYLLWKLSDGKMHKTDLSNASRTLMMNLATLDWDDEILSEWNIPRSMLPKIESSIGDFGTCTAIPGLMGVPVSAMLGDQQAALFGQCCFSVGEVKCTYGTGAFMMMNTGNTLVSSKQGLLTTVAYKIKDEAVVYALEGTVQYCGSLIQWLRDNMNVLKTNSESETLARQVDDNGGVYFVPAFAGLGAPYWDESARGMIIGLTAFNNKSHVVRAALEASAFQIKLVTDAMLVDFNTEITTLKVDGGGSQNSLLMQFQADLSNIPLYRAAVPETTALGVAFAAGLGVGAFESIEHIRSLWRQECAWMPSNARSDKATVTYAMWKRAVDRCTGWIE